MNVTKKTTVEEVFAEAQALSDIERDRLILMLDEHAREGLSEAEIEREWNEEAVRRHEDYKEGKDEAIPAEDVMRRLQQKYGQ